MLGRPLIVRNVAIPEIKVDLPPGSFAYTLHATNKNPKYFNNLTHL